MLRLEALRARKGDSLILHHGDGELVIVDGGPAGVWNQSLRPRLEAITAERGQDQLDIGMVMVSHIDDDHINGLLQMTDALVEQHNDRTPLAYDIKRLWHNSFDDVLGEPGAAVAQPVDGTVHTSVVDAVMANLNVGRQAAMTLASVAQGQRLRDNAALLGLNVNSGFARHDEIVQAGVRGPVRLGDLSIRVLGPRAERLAELQEKWDKEVKVQQDAARTAAYVDDREANLASIVVLIENRAGTKLLLTGDGRGDDILLAAREEGLLPGDGSFPVTLLKLPHHGSSNNVEQDFFATFPAEHYVVSGDGSHGNPTVETFEMLFAARRADDDPFTIWLTYDPPEYREHDGKPYPVDDLDKLFANNGRGARFTVMVPAADDLGVTIDLG